MSHRPWLIPAGQGAFCAAVISAQWVGYILVFGWVVPMFLTPLLAAVAVGLLAVAVALWVSAWKEAA